MHRLATQPGGWQPHNDGVIIVEQDPAPLVVMTAADTEIQALSLALKTLPETFPAIRVVNLLDLQQQLSIDSYADSVLAQAQGIMIRVLGGKSYWSYGLEVLKQVVATQGSQLIVMPGDDQPDWDLISHSTVGLPLVNQLWQYFIEGGTANLTQALCLMANQILGTTYTITPPQTLPKVGIWQDWQDLLETEPIKTEPIKGLQVGILVYRAHIIAGNVAPIHALCQALVRYHLQPLCLYTYSLREPELPHILLQYQGQLGVLLNTTSFSLAKLDDDTPDLDLWRQLDVPILQVILNTGSQEQWQQSAQGLSPRDLAINIALPEVDGRIITRAISHKGRQSADLRLQTQVITYQPDLDRIQFVAALAYNWVQLRLTPASQRRIGLMLANYPNRDGRLANGVGLDTPASCVNILKALALAGYKLGPIYPQTSTDLMEQLTSGITNDPMNQMPRSVQQSLEPDIYQHYFSTLPESVQTAICDRWGDLPTTPIPIPGLQLGHCFVGIQPSRGYDLDPSLSYHAPDLVPPHAYLAFYIWLRHCFGLHALVHVGKHGNLEWLPGKATALSDQCYPEICLGPVPHFYPFIVNDPGEGSQAKRRSQAVIIDHLTPPLTRSHLYGPLQQLENLLDEYAEAQTLDPKRAQQITHRISALVDQHHLTFDWSTDQSSQANQNFEAMLLYLDGYLCELKEAQIRDGLHILGSRPQGDQAVQLLQALARYPGYHQLGLTQAIAQDWGLTFDPVTTDVKNQLHPVDLE